MTTDYLPVDDSATVWSVAAQDLDHALQTRPLLILLHGYGADERDLAGLFGALPEHYLIASLRAPLPIPGLPRGRAWYPLDPAALLQPDAELADAATRGVLRWVEQVQARVRTPGPVGLLGFSQGGSIALQLLRHHPEQFACAVVLSGFVVPGLRAADAALEQIRPPVFWGHDPLDPVIPGIAQDRLGAFLRGHVDVTEAQYAVGHGIAAQEMDDVARFLRAHLT